MEGLQHVCWLGRGSFGTVALCKHHTSSERGKLVALKVFHTKDTLQDDKDRKAATMEVRISSAISGTHPGIPKLLRQFTAPNGRMCLLFEYGGSCLARLLQERFHNGMPPRILKKVAWQLVSVVRHLHASKVIHRDIKPANVLLDGKGVVRLCDYGFARHVGSADPRFMLPMTPYLVTRWYRAPEVLLECPYGAPSDVWSLGCTLAELAMGEPLMPGSSSLDQLWHMCRLLGPLPPHMMDRLADETQRTSISSNATSASAGTGCSLRERLAVVYDKYGGELVELLEACLRIDPRARPTAADLLDLPYFDEAPELLDGTAVQLLYEGELAEAKRRRLEAQYHRWQQQQQEALARAPGGAQGPTSRSAVHGYVLAQVGRPSGHGGGAAVCGADAAAALAALDACSQALEAPTRTCTAAGGPELNLDSDTSYSTSSSSVALLESAPSMDINSYNARPLSATPAAAGLPRQCPPATAAAAAAAAAMPMRQTVPTARQWRLTQLAGLPKPQTQFLPQPQQRNNAGATPHLVSVTGRSSTGPVPYGRLSYTHSEASDCCTTSTAAWRTSRTSRCTGRSVGSPSSGAHSSMGWSGMDGMWGGSTGLSQQQQQQQRKLAAPISRGDVTAAVMGAPVPVQRPCTDACFHLPLPPPPRPAAPLQQQQQQQQQQQPAAAPKPEPSGAAGSASLASMEVQGSRPARLRRLLPPISDSAESARAAQMRQPGDPCHDMYVSFRAREQPPVELESVSGWQLYQQGSASSAAVADAADAGAPPVELSAAAAAALASLVGATATPACLSVEMLPDEGGILQGQLEHERKSLPELHREMTFADTFTPSAERQGPPDKSAACALNHAGQVVAGRAGANADGSGPVAGALVSAGVAQLEGSGRGAVRDKSCGQGPEVVCGEAGAAKVRQAASKGFGRGGWLWSCFGGVKG